MYGGSSGGPDSSSNGDSSAGSEDSLEADNAPQSGGPPGEEHGGPEGKTPGTAEKAMMAVSVLFTVAVLAYAGWQVVTSPAATPAPEAEVVGTETLSDGRVAVTVQLNNRLDRGLIVATVESQCASPPPSVQFSYLPADSTRTGTLVCPAGTENPSVSVASWVEA